MAHLIYLLLAIICCYSLSQSWRERRFSVHDGFVLGGLYFFLIPSLLTLALGPIEAEGLPIASFSGERLDIAVFATACILPLLYFSLLKPSPIDETTQVGIGKLRFYFLIAAATTIFVFILSGKSEGKHWADSSTTDSLTANLLSVLLLVLRTYIFSLGMVVLRETRKGVGYLVIYTAIDVFLTGNRIAALYLAASIIFSRAYSLKTLALPAALLALPTTLFLSLYPAFRGVLWSEFGGFSGVWDAAIYVFKNQELKSFDPKFIWYFFEAANTCVFQHLYDTYGHAIDLLDGATVLVKPLSLFVPRELWPDKPEGLGIRLGPALLGIDGLSLNSLLLGEFWVNFGWAAPLGIVATMTLAYIAYTYTKILQRKDLVCFGFLLGFASWRHEFNYFVFSTLAGCALIWILDPISAHFDDRAEVQ